MDQAGGRIHLPHAESRRLLRQRQTRRGVGQRLHPLALLVDVDDGAADQHRSAVHFGHAVLLTPPAVRAVGIPCAVLDLIVAAIPQRGLEHPACRGQIVGMDVAPQLVLMNRGRHRR